MYDQVTLLDDQVAIMLFYKTGSRMKPMASLYATHMFMLSIFTSHPAMHILGSSYSSCVQHSWSTHFDGNFHDCATLGFLIRFWVNFLTLYSYYRPVL